MVLKTLSKMNRVDAKYHIEILMLYIRKQWKGWVKMLMPPIFLYWYRKKKEHVAPRKMPKWLREQVANNKIIKINLCCGPAILDDYLNIDMSPSADLVIDLEKELLPFKDNSVESLVCMSAINYFTKRRALDIIKDVHRVLRPGGVTRFGVQDLKILAEKYLRKDRNFYFQKHPDGQTRFPGETFGDKFNHFFYGFESLEHKHCKYVYDFDTLKLLCEKAGFYKIEEKKYQESALPEIKNIDNRPEQMFYLEAVKSGDVRSFGEEGTLLWESGQKEKSWQFLLKSLDVDSTDRITILKMLDILLEYNNTKSSASLLSKYLKQVPDDQEIRKRLNNVRAKLTLRKMKPVELNAQKSHLDKYNLHQNTILTDKEHLKESIKWLRQTYYITNDGGMSSHYDLLHEKWGSSYPETTGYIIPTFLCYAKLTGDQSYRRMAIEMGDWEIRIQSVEGGAGEPIGVCITRPRIFNTGQVMLGWLSLYKETGKEKYLEALIKASDFLVRNMGDDGKWLSYTFTGESKAYKSRVIWTLLEVYAITTEVRYQQAAELSVSWVLQQAKSNGWFYNNGFLNSKPITHLIGYNLVGLLEIYRLKNVSFNYDRVLNIFSMEK